MYSIFVSHSAGPHFTGQIVFGMTPASRTEHLGANCCPVSEGQHGVQSCSRQSALRKCCSQTHKHQGKKIFIWNEKFKNPTNKQKGGESIIKFILTFYHQTSLVCSAVCCLHAFCETMKQTLSRLSLEFYYLNGQLA